MTAAAVLAADLAEVDLDREPAPALTWARYVFADTIACIVAGLKDTEVAALRATLTVAGRREPVTGVECVPGDTAMLLGFAAAALELDEGHYAAGGHPAAPVVAALLAEAAARATPIEELLEAVVLGYEAGARVGRAAHLRADMHPHGTWGTVGAAVAVAVLRRRPTSDWARVIDIAASLATSTSSETPLLGGSIRSAWIGVSARNGLLACDLAQAGVTPGEGALERIFGGIIGADFTAGQLRRPAEDPLLVTTNFMKTEACCRETQGALAAFDTALQGATIPPDAIGSISVTTFAAACALGEPEAANATAARFSIPAVLAARLLHGQIGPDGFSVALLRSAEFRRLARSVRLSVAPDAEAARTSRVEIRTVAGEVLTGEVDGCPGDPGDTLPPEALKRKFHALFDRGEQSAGDAVWNRIFDPSIEVFPDPYPWKGSGAV